MKIIRATIISQLSIIWIRTRATEFTIEDQLWTTAPPTMSYAESRNTQWRGDTFNPAEHSGGLEIGDQESDFHLVVAPTKFTNTIMIYTLSQTRQVYLLQDKERNRFYHGGIKPNEIHYTKTKLLTVALLKHLN
jgi:hypothetical protein